MIVALNKEVMAVVFNQKVIVALNEEVMVVVLFGDSSTPSFLKISLAANRRQPFNYTTSPKITF